ncbi:MAG TPA: DUF1972 domain-containing protein [Flavipsychrobacter sp.]|nr:DUF1972 domain-containing protein [Flavipsychrobacter sp.]
MASSIKIGILGTRGIPNRYGGFEQCAEYLAIGLLKRGHEVWVYNSNSHEYRDSEWNGVHIIHCKDPEDRLGTFGQFLYDRNCIQDARKRNFDILLQLGYTSNSVWYRIWPKNCKNIVNMDGLEWKRSKYNRYVQQFLKKAERWAALNADALIADSIGIQQHLKEIYNKPSIFIPYGAEIFRTPNEELITGFSIQPYQYHLLIARMEPENNIETIIKGYLRSASEKPLLVVGKTGNTYGAYLKKKYADKEGVRFLGGIYDTDIINNLRYYSLLYFHGHSVGGTNPSLLEAMACNCLIAAHDNVFNKSVLSENAFYFSDDKQLAAIIKNNSPKQSYSAWLDNNIEKIQTKYNWENIVDEYEQVFLTEIKKR